MVFPGWSYVRTAVAVGGMAFVAVGLGGACLDHVGEIAPRCEQGAPDAGADCGAAAVAPRPVSGSGSGSASP